MRQKIQISLFLFNLFFIILVIVLAGNKSDLYEQEVVNEREARKYAKEIGATFKLTSAFTGAGINEMFRTIGCKILDPDYVDKDDDNEDDNDADNKNNDSNNSDNNNKSNNSNDNNNKETVKKEKKDEYEEYHKNSIRLKNPHKKKEEHKKKCC